MVKKIILFFLLFIPWFFSSILISDFSFYKTLTLPTFAPSAFIFGIIWPILYFLIAISSTMIFQNDSYKQIPSYMKAFLWNYGFNQLFPICFFLFHNLFLSFVDSTIVFVTSLFLYYETKELNTKASKLLIPYVLWCLFAMILSMVVYFLNL